jgi:hypothetical protein
VRLQGYATRRSALGWGASYVPLDELTVLLGANDAGKSTLLNALDEDLRGGPASPEGDEMVTSAGALFVEVDDHELAELLPRRRAGSARFSSSWALGGYDNDRLDSAGSSIATRDPADWLRLLGEASETSETFGPALGALASSRTVCFETEVRQDGERRATVAYWCLPAPAELDAPVLEALQASRLRRFLPEGDPGRRPRLPRLRFGGDLHLQLDAAPVAVAPLGWQPLFAAPVPLRAPADFRAVRTAVDDAVTRAVVAVRHGEADAVDATHWTREEEEARRAPGVWLAGEHEQWRIDPAARWALDVLSIEARTLLAPFAAERYDLVLRFRQPAQWFTNAPIAIELRRRDIESLVVAFPIEQVAEGLALWVQLALIGAAQELERLSGRLQLMASEAAEQARELEEATATEQGGDDDTWLPEVEAWREVVEAIADSAPGQPRVTEPLRRTQLSGQTLRRVVLVDEPERHLNPRLQRQAAAWLQHLVTSSATPCIAASHSNAFLSLPAPTSFAHVRRDGMRVTVERLDPRRLDALDAVAQELGFDRGELLVAVGCFLIVEGVHDQIVLEHVFDRQLCDAGVLVVPLRGGVRKSLLDADALWRYTTAPVALALDHIALDDLGAAQGGDADALARLTHADASEESKAAGNLLRHARGMGRELHVLGHPGLDLIDALHDDAVSDVYGDYPGAEAMHEAWQAHVAERREAGEIVAARRRKAWLQTEYGIDNSREAYERIAEVHVTLGLKPPGLTPIALRAAELGMRSLSED